jgi:hypothetical protein
MTLWSLVARYQTFWDRPTLLSWHCNFLWNICVSLPECEVSHHRIRLYWASQCLATRMWGVASQNTLVLSVTLSCYQNARCRITEYACIERHCVSLPECEVSHHLIRLYWASQCLATRMRGVASHNALVLSVTAVRTSVFVSQFSFPRLLIRYLLLRKSKIRRRMFCHTRFFSWKLKKSCWITRRKCNTLSLRNQQCCNFENEGLMLTIYFHTNIKRP